MHKFRYRAFWFLVDLDELAELSSRLRLFSHNRRNLFQLLRTPTTATAPQRRSVRRWNASLARQESISLADRSACFACRARSATASIRSAYTSATVADGALAALVYQVHNTFGERHSYVMPVGRRERRGSPALSKDLLRLSLHGHEYAL